MCIILCDIILCNILVWFLDILSCLYSLKIIFTFFCIDSKCLLKIFFVNCCRKYFVKHICLLLCNYIDMVAQNWNEKGIPADWRSNCIYFDVCIVLINCLHELIIEIFSISSVAYVYLHRFFNIAVAFCSHSLLLKFQYWWII